MATCKNHPDRPGKWMIGKERVQGDGAVRLEPREYLCDECSVEAAKRSALWQRT
jgi:hypothetical protein